MSRRPRSDINQDYLRFQVFDADGRRHCVAMEQLGLMPLYLTHGITQDDYRLLARYVAKLLPTERVINYSRTLHARVAHGLEQGGTSFLKVAQREYDGLKSMTKQAVQARRRQADEWTLARVQRAADHDPTLLKRALASLGNPVIDRPKPTPKARPTKVQAPAEPKVKRRPARRARPTDGMTDELRLGLVEALFAARDGAE